MQRVGFVGLGIMGSPMAISLVKAGFPVTVFNRTRSKYDPAVNMGASPAESPAEVASKSDVIITIVSDTAAVESVLFGPQGLWRSAGKNKTVIDMSSISPSATIEFERRLAEQGCDMLDAPVSGGARGARRASLSIMVGGKREVFEKCLPIFRALGQTITYTGPIGNGQKTKLVNQVVGAMNILSLVEGVRLARALGLDLAATLQVVSNGAASSWMLANLGPKILSGDFTPGFTLQLHDKDLKLAKDAIQATGLAFPGAELVCSLFAEAVDKGLGGQGNQGLINLWDESAKG